MEAAVKSILGGERTLPKEKEEEEIDADMYSRGRCGTATLNRI
jgi:hypothetical protein